MTRSIPVCGVYNPAACEYHHYGTVQPHRAWRSKDELPSESLLRQYCACRLGSSIKPAQLTRLPYSEYSNKTTYPLELKPTGRNSNKFIVIMAHENKLPGDPLTARSQVLETAAGATQALTPVKQICAHLHAFHVYASDPTRCVEANHYCSHLTEGALSCLTLYHPRRNEQE